MRLHSVRPLSRWQVAAAAWLLLLSGAAAAAENPMDCTEEITVPNVTGALMTSVPATVQVRILIADNGRAASVDFGTAKPIFRLELGHYFSEGARYLKACQGKTITFTVRYVVRARRRLDPYRRYVSSRRANSLLYAVLLSRPWIRSRSSSRSPSDGPFHPSDQHLPS
jgi:hypothetical protein